MALFFTGAREMGLTSFEDGSSSPGTRWTTSGRWTTATRCGIEMWVEEIRASRFTIAYELFDADVVASRARSVCVPFDLAQQRPRRLPTPSGRSWRLGRTAETLIARRARADAGAFLARLLRLDPAAVVRLRPARATGGATTLGHAAVRGAGRPGRCRRRRHRRHDGRGGGPAAPTPARAPPPARRDEAWRWPLPPGGAGSVEASRRPRSPGSRRPPRGRCATARPKASAAGRWASGCCATHCSTTCRSW